MLQFTQRSDWPQKLDPVARALPPGPAGDISGFELIASAENAASSRESSKGAHNVYEYIPPLSPR